MGIQHLRDDPAAWAVLEERARQLASQETAVQTVSGDPVLTFRLGVGRYSLPVRYVREVQPLTSYTPLPATPSFVVGLVNVRGRLLCALDIRPLLDIAFAPPPQNAALIIISANSVEMGLIADEVFEVQADSPELAPSLAAVSGRGVDWVRGVDSHLSLQLDPPRMLADPRLTVTIAAG